MKVHEIMTAHARCAAPDNSIVEAAGLMRELDVGVLPVCDSDRLAGMITDRDIVLRAVADGRGPYETTVRDVMSPGVVWVFADQDVEEAARMMEEKQIRRLPVLNREKRLVGIVSLGDVAVSSNPAFSGQALREVSESPEQHMQGGRTPGSVRRSRLGMDGDTAPRGARRIPAGTRKGGARTEDSDTEGRETAAGDRRGRGSAAKASKTRGAQRRGRDTTHGASARASGKGGQAKGRGRKKSAAKSARRSPRTSAARR